MDLSLAFTKNNNFTIKACVAALLKAGADPMSGDLSNNTPLHMAVIGSHYDCVRELLNNDEVDVNFPNNEGK